MFVGKKSGFAWWHSHACLFLIPVHENASVQRLAELAVISLYKNPEKLAFIQRLNVLCFDELGQVAAEVVSCLDLIFCMVRKSDQFFGGGCWLLVRLILYS